MQRKNAIGIPFLDFPHCFALMDEFPDEIVSLILISLNPFDVFVVAHVSHRLRRLLFPSPTEPSTLPRTFFSSIVASFDYNNHSKFCNECARLGYVNLLIWGRSRRTPLLWEATTFSLAAALPSAQMLKYCIENKCPESREIYVVGSSEGLDLLRPLFDFSVSTARYRPLETALQNGSCRAHIDLLLSQMDPFKLPLKVKHLIYAARDLELFEHLFPRLRRKFTARADARRLARWAPDYPTFKLLLIRFGVQIITYIVPFFHGFMLHKNGSLLASYWRDLESLQLTSLLCEAFLNSPRCLSSINQDALTFILTSTPLGPQLLRKPHAAAQIMHHLLNLPLAIELVEQEPILARDLSIPLLIESDLLLSRFISQGGPLYRRDVQAILFAALRAHHWKLAAAVAKGVTLVRHYAISKLVSFVDWAILEWAEERTLLAPSNKQRILNLLLWDKRPDLVALLHRQLGWPLNEYTWGESIRLGHLPLISLHAAANILPPRHLFRIALYHHQLTAVTHLISLGFPLPPPQDLEGLALTESERKFLQMLRNQDKEERLDSA